jgi:DME family drug/metabolite transporter
LLQPVAWLATGSGLLMALWLGLGTTTAAYCSSGAGCGCCPPARPTLVLAEPVVATLLGVLVLDERLGLLGWAGGALVIAGLALQGASSSRERTVVDIEG